MNLEKLQLASVKLINNGMKGIEIEYLLPSIKGNIQFFDTYKAKRKAPVHSELEDTFSWLKSHLLDICGYTLDEMEREYLMGQTSVTGIKYGDKGIIIYGDLFVLGGTRVLKMETPLITDEVEYPEFGKLKSIVEGIYAETKEYLAGKKVMSDAQIVARFNKGKVDFDEESFTKMTKEEQRDLATKILEAQGCMVFHNDEIIAEEPQLDLPKELPKAKPEPKAKKEKEVAPTPVVDAFGDEIQPEVQPKLKNVPEDLSVEASRKKPEEVITLTADDDDFSLPLVKMPKKETTKKKVA